MQPYTYRIRHIESGKSYYGKRTAKNCNPNDLGTTYFSSSKQLLSLIAQEGKDAFEFEVRKVFETADEASYWEYKVIQRLRACKSKNWFNIANGFKLSNTEAVARSNRSRVCSDQERQRKSEAAKKQVHSAERRAAMSKKMKGRTFSEETLAKMKKNHWSHKLPKSPNPVPRRSVDSRNKTSASLKGKTTGVKRYNDGVNNYTCLPINADSSWNTGVLRSSPKFSRI